jgi:hypothetical protein
MLDQRAHIESLNRSGGVAAQPRYETIYPSHFGLNLSGPSRLQQIAGSMSATKSDWHGFLTALIMLFILAIQYFTIQEVRQTQSQMVAELANGNRLPPGVTVQALQEKFTNIGSVLSFLLKTAKAPTERSRPEYIEAVQRDSDRFPAQRDAMADTNPARDADTNNRFSEFGLKRAVGVITVPSANLRAGAGKQYPVIMTVAQGMRFVIDGYQDGWYSVTAPTGETLWISTEVLSLRPIF